MSWMAGHCWLRKRRNGPIVPGVEGLGEGIVAGAMAAGSVMTAGTAGAMDTQKGVTIAGDTEVGVILRAKATGNSMNHHVVRWLKESDDPRAVVARVMGVRSSSLEAREVVACIRAVRLRVKRRGVSLRKRVR